MKKLLLAASIFVALQVKAQMTPTWEKPMTENVEWQQITSLGNFILNTENGLKSIDPDTGNELWNIASLAGIDQNAFMEIPNTPLAKVSQGNDVWIVNIFDGSVLFDAAKEGFAKVKEEHVLFRGNIVWIAGKTEDKKELQVAVDLDQAKVLWKTNEELGRIVNITEHNESQFLLASLFNVYMFNSRTGDVIWKNAISKEAASVASMGKFGNLMQKAAEGMTANMDIQIDFQIDPAGTYFSIGTEEKKETESTTGGEPTITYTNSYQVFDMETGKFLLKKPYKSNGQLGLSTWHNGKLIVLPNNKMSSKINMIDPTTGLGLWGKKGKGIKMKGGLISYTMVDNGLFLISDRNGKNFMDYLDLKTGMLSFEKSIKVKGAVGFTKLTPKGMVYATSRELNIVDLNTGELAFEKDYRTTYSLVRAHAAHIYFMDTKDYVLRGLDETTGLQDYVSKEEVKFEEKEWVNNMEFKENGILLSADQNFLMLDNSGAKVYQTWLPSPREEGWKRALLYSSAVLSMYTSAITGVASVATSAAGASQEDGSVEQQALMGAGNSYAELSAASGALAKSALNAANKRFKATAQGRDYAVVLTNLRDDGGIQLAKLNKTTGEKEKAITLGKDRKPNYTIDLVTGKLFLIKDGKIFCYEL